MFELGTRAKEHFVTIIEIQRASNEEQFWTGQYKMQTADWF